MAAVDCHVFGVVHTYFRVEERHFDVVYKIVGRIDFDAARPNGVDYVDGCIGAYGSEVARIDFTRHILRARNNSGGCRRGRETQQ